MVAAARSVRFKLLGQVALHIQALPGAALLLQTVRRPTRSAVANPAQAVLTSLSGLLPQKSLQAKLLCHMISWVHVASLLMSG